MLNAPSTAISLLTGSMIRENLAVPVGCGPSNGTDPKAWSIPRELWGKLGFTVADSAIHALATLWSDFLLYGPIENAKWVFPAVTLAEMVKVTFRVEATRDFPELNEHPLKRFFSEFVEQLKEA